MNQSTFFFAFNFPELPRYRVEAYLRRNKHWAKRAPLIKALGEAPLRHSAGVGRVSLPYSRRYIVAAGIPGYIIQSFLLGNVLAGLANDNAHFAFIVQLIHLRHDFRNGDILSPVRDRLRRLDELGGVWGWVASSFLDYNRRLSA